MNKITDAQVVALVTYANANGRTWKAKLNDDWVNGRADSELQQVRNQFGPTWLTRFKLPGKKITAVEVRTGKLIARWRGLPNEFGMLHGVLCLTHCDVLVWGRYDGMMIAEHLDALNGKDVEYEWAEGRLNDEGHSG